MHTTQQDFDIMTTVGEVFFNLILGDESGTTSPTRGRVIEHVEDLEPGWVGSCQLIQFSLE